MPEIPRTKFNSPWTVANIEAALNDVSSAKGSSESLTAALNAMRADEAEDRAALVELVDGGAKSLLNPEDTVSDKTLRGVTVTRTGDVYSFSGTAENNSNIFININNDTTINNFPAGDYVAIFEQPQNDIKLQVGINGTITYAGEFGEPLFFTIPSTATSNWIRFFFTRLVNYTGRTGRIMICTEAAWKISQAYQPYRPSWQEMWDAIQALQSGGNRALTMQMQQPEEQEER